MYLSRRECPVCGCRVAEKIFELRIRCDDCNLPNRYYVSKCEFCGMCYADTNATKEDYDRYYMNDNSYGGLKKVSKTFKPNYKVTRDAIGSVAGYNDKIIDVGFGDGGFLSYLKHEGFDNLTGLDPSTQSVQALIDEGLQGVVASIQGEVDIHERFDVVVSTAVLEHIYDVGKAIDNMLKMVKKDGYVVLNLPVFDRIENHFAPLVDIINQEHINYFSHISLKNIMGIHGCKEVSYTEAFTTLEDGSLAYFCVGVYNKCDNDNYVIKVDTKTSFEIEKYVKKRNLLNLKKIVERISSSSEEIVLWGMGAYLRYLWENTDLSELKILYIVDGNERKWGKLFSGYKIISPEQLKATGFKGSICITAIFNNNAIKETIQMLGLSNKIYSFRDIT